MGLGGNAMKLLQRKVDKHDFEQELKQKVGMSELEMIMRLIEIMHK